MYINIKVPLQLKQSYNWHNGQNDNYNFDINRIKRQ